MESSENLNNKILEERQVEKFSQFIESYEEAVGNLKKKLSSNKNQPLTASTNVSENVSFYSLTGKKQFLSGIDQMMDSLIKIVIMEISAK